MSAINVLLLGLGSSACVQPLIAHVAQIVDTVVGIILNGFALIVIATVDRFKD